jgi:hypothetical protein
MSNSTPGVASLEAELEICREAARKALARADAIDPAYDEYGHGISAAQAAALKFLKMSAKIGLALAKLKGEHTSTIRIHKTETNKPAPVLDRPVRLVPPEPEKFHAAWKKFTAENFGWQWYDEEDDFGKTVEEGVPPSISQGSNASTA